MHIQVDSPDASLNRKEKQSGIGNVSQKHVKTNFHASIATRTLDDYYSVS